MTIGRVPFSVADGFFSLVQWYGTVCFLKICSGNIPKDGRLYLPDIFLSYSFNHVNSSIPLEVVILGHLFRFNFGKSDQDNNILNLVLQTVYDHQRILSMDHSWPRYNCCLRSREYVHLLHNLSNILQISTTHSVGDEIYYPYRNNYRCKLSLDMLFG